MTRSEAAERCVQVACARSRHMSASVGAQLATDDVSIDEWPTGIHLSIETLTSEMVEAIIKEVQKR